MRRESDRNGNVQTEMKPHESFGCPKCCYSGFLHIDFPDMARLRRCECFKNPISDGNKSILMSDKEENKHAIGQTRPVSRYCERCHLKRGFIEYRCGHVSMQMSLSDYQKIKYQFYQNCEKFGITRQLKEDQFVEQ
jgi:hypothetical protein